MKQNLLEIILLLGYHEIYDYSILKERDVPDMLILHPVNPILSSPRLIFGFSGKLKYYWDPVINKYLNVFDEEEEQMGIEQKVIFQRMKKWLASH